MSTGDLAAAHVTVIGAKGGVVHDPASGPKAAVWFATINRGATLTFGDFSIL